MVDSAGTGAWHEGESPDPRAVHAGQKRGYSFAGQTARKLQPSDFETFDFVLAMDQNNLEYLQEQCPSDQAHKVRLFLSFADNISETVVPDPYYGGDAGFDHVLDLVEAASDGLITHLA